MKNPMLLIDGHLDLAWNMLTFGRDYTRPLAEIRAAEAGTQIKEWNGTTALGWDAFRQANTAVIFATLFAAPYKAWLGDWDIFCYHDFEQAHAMYRDQLNFYERWIGEHPEQLRLLRSRADFNTHWAEWQNATTEQTPPIGLVLLIENAEGVRDPHELEFWWESGIRLIGPAWRGTRYCGGTQDPGPLTDEGKALLRRMGEIGFTLDLSHMDEAAFMQALEIYEGPLIASHSNAHALVPRETNRHLSRAMIDGLLERDGIIGVVPLNGFLDAEWKKGDDRATVPLHKLAAQIDHYCQRAGNTQHVAIGSDLDGGHGIESLPDGVDSIADLHKLAPLLRDMGYSEIDLKAIFHGNWQRFLETSLPA
jgi:membrane dipeptidase